MKLAIDFRSVGHTWGVVTNLSEVPLFLDSKASRLVQLADLVAFSLYRYHEAQDNRFIDIIQERFDGRCISPSVAEWVATTRLMPLWRHKTPSGGPLAKCLARARS